LDALALTRNTERILPIFANARYAGLRFRKTLADDACVSVASPVDSSPLSAVATNARTILAVTSHPDAVILIALADTAQTLTFIADAADTSASSSMLTKNAGYVLVIGISFNWIHMVASFICVILSFFNQLNYACRPRGATSYRLLPNSFLF
jgi:hypothetical protein